MADTDYNALGKVDQYEMYTGLFSETGSRFFRSFTYELETGRLTGSRTDRDSVAPHTITDVRYSYDEVGNIKKIVRPGRGRRARITSASATTSAAVGRGVDAVERRLRRRTDAGRARRSREVLAEMGHRRGRSSADGDRSCRAQR